VLVARRDGGLTAARRNDPQSADRIRDGFHLLVPHPEGSQDLDRAWREAAAAGLVAGKLVRIEEHDALDSVPEERHGSRGAGGSAADDGDAAG